jgi:quinol monooxygenase YgiN
MAHVIVKHTVEDYGSWKPVFDADATRRSNAGCTSERVYRDADNPNAITVLMEFGSHDQAHAFANDPKLAETMKKGGVISRPDVSYLNAVE